MKRTLQGSKSTKNFMPNMETLTQQAQSMDPGQVNDVQNLVNHYSGKSESELLNELRFAKQTGAFNTAELAGMAQRLAPMLTPEQQQRLLNVMSQLQ